MKVIKENYFLIIFSLTIFISIFIGGIFMLDGQLHLADYDSIARLNIARKTFDSITPGLGQLGGIWLPFPQFLMIPFVVNDFLYYSGIAGAIVSMASFIAGGLFIYLTANLLTNNKLAATVAWLIYVTNSNLLLLQTSSMSETFFLFLLIMIMYFLTRWFVKKQLFDIFYAGFFVTLITLTRYEGYIILLASILTVFMGAFLVFGRKNRSKIEGQLIIFTTLSVMGIVIWSIYSLAIYGDLIYWFHLYTGATTGVPTNQVALDTAASSIIETKQSARTIFSSLSLYSWISTLMIGIPIVLLSIVAYVFFLIVFVLSFFKKKIDVKYLPFFVLSLSVFLFLVVGYQYGIIPGIQAPPFALSSLTDKSLNNMSNSNIRYGIIMLPFVSLVLSLLASKSRVFVALIIIVLSFQIYTYFYTPYFLTFHLSKKWEYKEGSAAIWLRNNYDGGLVMISANKYEPLMFQSGLPYKTFIYEGSQKYWKDSLEKPSKYASWVIFTPNLKKDNINDYLKNREQLEEYYDLVYQKNGLRIYKIKEKPDIILSNKK